MRFSWFKSKKISNVSLETEAFVKKPWRWLKVTVVIFIIAQIVWVINSVDSVVPSDIGEYYLQWSVTLLVIDIVYILIMLISIWLISLPFYRSVIWTLLVRQGVTIVFVCFAMWSVRTALINPLPNDEVFIAHLEQHQEEFDELIACYRSGKCKKVLSITDAALAKKDKAFMQRLGISGIGRGNLVAGSTNTKDFGALGTPKDRNSAQREAISLAVRRYVAVGQTLKQRDGFMSIGLIGLSKSSCILAYGFGSCISKGLYHKPGKPVIEDGWISWPIHDLGEGGGWVDGERQTWSLDDLGVMTIKYRLFNSLNHYVTRVWKADRCFLRQIKPEWYIRMCKSR